MGLTFDRSKLDITEATLHESIARYRRGVGEFLAVGGDFENAWQDDSPANQILCAAIQVLRDEIKYEIMGRQWDGFEQGEVTNEEAVEMIMQDRLESIRDLVGVIQDQLANGDLDHVAESIQALREMGENTLAMEMEQAMMDSGLSQPLRFSMSILIPQLEAAVERRDDAEIERILGEMYRSTDPEPVSRRGPEFWRDRIKQLRQSPYKTFSEQRRALKDAVDAAENGDYDVAGNIRDQICIRVIDSALADYYPDMIESLMVLKNISVGLRKQSVEAAIAGNIEQAQKLLQDARDLKSEVTNVYNEWQSTGDSLVFVNITNGQIHEYRKP